MIQIRGIVYSLVVNNRNIYPMLRFSVGNQRTQLPHNIRSNKVSNYILNFHAFVYFMVIYIYIKFIYVWQTQKCNLGFSIFDSFRQFLLNLFDFIIYSVYEEIQTFANDYVNSTLHFSLA